MNTLSIRGLRKRFSAVRAPVLDGVDLTIRAGETVALLGRSGVGKSTLARCLVGLERPDAGAVEVDGVRYDPRRRRARRLVQMVWQDSFPSLSPYRTIRQSLREPLDAFGTGLDARELLQTVGLGPDILDRRPHELSGGECQRVVIARALAAGPRVLILDEPLSALDAPAQAEIVPVLRTASHAASGVVLFISHDLTAVRHLATRVAVLDGGKVVEEKPVADFFASPEHPASRALLDAWPPLPFT